MSEPTHDEHGPAVSHEDEHEAHGSFALYFSVFVALLILTAISFATPHVFGQSPIAMRAIMIAVSCCKALLVILFFMHLKWEANWKYVLTFPAMCMSLFLMLMLVPDVGWRGYHSSYERALHMADPHAVEPPKVVPHAEDPAAITPEATAPGRPDHAPHDDRIR